MPRVSLLRPLPAAFIGLTALAAAGGFVVARGDPEPPAMTPITTGTELVMVFIATSTCSGIDDPNLATALRRVRDGLRQEAREKGQTFVSLGVSLDWTIETGTEMLERFGPFDEIAVGRGWLNIGAIKYLWNYIPGRPAVPQIVVVERKVNKGRAITVDEEHARYRKVGAPTIVRWSELAFGGT